VYERFGIEMGLSKEVEDIATNCGECEPLLIDDIDALCLRINDDDARAPVARLLREQYRARYDFAFHRDACPSCKTGKECEKGTKLRVRALELGSDVYMVLMEEKVDEVLDAHL